MMDEIDIMFTTIRALDIILNPSKHYKALQIMYINRTFHTVPVSCGSFVSLRLLPAAFFAALMLSVLTLNVLRELSAF